MHFNRGNHESFDMNVRGFNEGGGFAHEVMGKYDSDTFALFQVRRAASALLRFRHGVCSVLMCGAAWHGAAWQSLICRTCSTYYRWRRASTTRS